MPQNRWTVLSWTSPFLALALIVFLFTSSIGQGQAPLRGRASQQLICTISSFFSIDAGEQVSGVLEIEGRGLANCKNDQGFSTDVPISATLSARATRDLTNAGELSFSGNSSSFVVNREIGQLQDTFVVKPYVSDVNDKSTPTVVFEGAHHDLIMEMKFSSTTDAFQKIQVTNLALHFDENAPTLE